MRSPGRAIEWETIRAVAGSQAIDMWLLFPLGIGVNRLLTKRLEDIPESWRRRLTTLLGTDEWEHEFYRTESAKMLFGENEIVVKAPLDVIARYFVNRLKTLPRRRRASGRAVQLERLASVSLLLRCRQ